ncbi:hypothetical protein AB0M92_18910 [Streptomyces sp. NPDC051582]|uniref:hypothetical protein n=1 Tax=Streptomyces sp. NPDC051582 TaxID=3155167 RepID=UPI003430586D
MDTCIASTCTRELRDHEIAARQLLCDPCVWQLRAWLKSIPNLMIVLREGSMQREVCGAGGRSGTKTPPLPGRIDTLNLTGPAAAGPIREHIEDQCGDIPIAGVLAGWVRVVIEKRPAAPPKATTEIALAAWLTLHIGWASQQTWVREMRDEIHDAMRTIWGITRLQPQTHAVTRPCPRCDLMTLTRTDHDLYTRCSSCGTSYTGQELGDDAARRVAAA